jgi:hypothetical protein
MKRLVEALERRSHPRVEWHLPCKLLVDGGVHRGSLWNISVGGFFVTTGAGLHPGAGAVIAFDTPEGGRFVLEVSVLHKRRVSRSLTDLLPVGLGLHVEEPPPAYLRWVEVFQARSDAVHRDALAPPAHPMTH